MSAAGPGRVRHDVEIAGTGEHYACGSDESVLDGMARLGRRGIPLGCRGGGCGVCKIRITAGRYRCRAMSCQHVGAEDLAAGVVLACRVMPESDLVLEVLGRMQKCVCAGRAAGAADGGGE